MLLPLPEPLRPLLDLVHNLRWSWNREARRLFRDLDPGLWEASGRNPVRLLRTIERWRLEAAAHDESYLTRLREVAQDLRSYRDTPGWFQRECPEASGLQVAYFAAEFGLAECVPLYSGGLGILSGDHLKSASDLGVPLTGVGLLYRHGYFTQRISPEGDQIERYPVTEFEELPLNRETTADGRSLTVTLKFPGREVAVEVWRADVGRVRLLLLDTRVEQNRPEDQVITGALYAGDRETRLQQELVLGIGGLRALAAIGLKPDVCHMNEGHAAFLVLERIRQLVQEEKLGFAEAREAARAGNVFTTHTPVPAGFDVFEPELVRRYLTPCAEELGISWPEFLALGGSDGHSPFSMVALALNNAARCNAVSALHREVSRGLFRGFQPPQEAAADGLEHVANGIHTRSWIAPEMKDLLNRTLGTRWLDEPHDAEAWEGIDAVPDADLWAVHCQRRARLVDWVRHRLPQQLERRGMDPAELAWARQVLDPDALTIGWARRFATYKRALLLFRDTDRLRRLLEDPGRPVQILIAGKAHPHDEPGKELLRAIVRLAAQPDFRSRVVVLANYDIAVARMLVRGVDLWLNTPRRPQEASGTSGMKVAPNGGLNLSILDGWWAEAYTPEVGWALGGTEAFQDPEAQDEVESRLLYELLEGEVVPLFFERGPDGIPRGWITRVKASMKKLCPNYNTNRMVSEYVERFYLPAAGADGGAAVLAEREPAGGEGVAP